MDAGEATDKTITVADIFIQYKDRLTFSNSNSLFQVWLQKFRKLNHKRRQSEISNGTFCRVYFL